MINITLMLNKFPFWIFVRLEMFSEEVKWFRKIVKSKNRFEMSDSVTNFL